MQAQLTPHSTLPTDKHIATPTTSADAKDTPKSFTVLTWNLCLLNQSFQAPPNWRMDLTEAKIREHVLDTSPDFVCFQELPGLVPYVETHDLIPAHTMSHSGTIATLAKHEWMDDLESQALGRFAVLTTIKSTGLTIANVHLEPGSHGTFKRIQMLNDICNACSTPALLIIGDTNTRVEEEEPIGKIDLAGTRPTRPTWDTRKNKFRDDGRAYTAYYTRYFHNDKVQVKNVVIWDKPIVEDGKRFYLSDHFAMSVRAEVTPKL